MHKIYLIALFAAFCLTGINDAKGQSQDPHIIQLTGVILTEQGRAMTGAHIYVPKAGRGTSTNLYGYFSMPALVGETIVVSSVGYLKQEFIIPEAPKGRLNIGLQMVIDTTYLQNVDITPYLSEKMFKEAILAMELPDQNAMIGGRLDGAALSSMLGSVPYDASLNARYYFDQQYYYQQDNFGPRSNPFLNPFNWANFIKGLKKK